MEDLAKDIIKIANEIINEKYSSLQVNRKDKDLMSDTGGGSYKRKEPDLKPSRTDCFKPFSEKNKKPNERDSDTESDTDLK